MGVCIFFLPGKYPSKESVQHAAVSFAAQILLLRLSISFGWSFVFCSRGKENKENLQQRNEIEWRLLIGPKYFFALSLLLLLPSSLPEDISHKAEPRTTERKIAAASTIWGGVSVVANKIHY